MDRHDEGLKPLGPLGMSFLLDALCMLHFTSDSPVTQSFQQTYWALKSSTMARAGRFFCGPARWG